MAILLRLFSVYTVLVALLVAIKFIFGAVQPEWSNINWLMAAGVIITVGGALYCKKQMEADEGAGNDARRFLDVNVPFYAAMALLIAFAFQWSAELNGHVQQTVVASGEEMSIGSLWAYIDTLYIVLTGMIGVRIWRAAGKV